MSLAGKTVLFLGSSVTWGVDGVSFVEMLAKEYGLQAVKEAVSGTTLVDVDDTSYVARLQRVDRALCPALFVCQLSTNDAVRGLPLADIEQAIRFIIGYVNETWGCPILFYTGTRFENAHYAGMVALLLRLQAELGFSVLDLWHDAAMLAVSPADYQRYMRDPVHPSLEGYHEWWLPKFFSAISAILD